MSKAQNSASAAEANTATASEAVADSASALAYEAPEIDKKKRWWALGFLAASVSLIVIDGTIVNVALPVMVRDLKLNFSNAEWITTLYALIFSALLLTMGRLADKIGRRTVLIVGILFFAAGSLLASLATAAAPLLWARAVQGLGGSMVLPTTLSTVNAVFRGRSRSIAFAVWGSVISGMAAIGPLLGGFLTTKFSWPWIFYINLPIAAIILIGVIATVPQTKAPNSGDRGLDVDGFILSVLAMGGIVYALIEARTHGWWKPLEGSWEYNKGWAVSSAGIAIVVGVVSLILFILWELHRIRNGRSKLLDLRLFKIGSFSLGNIAAGSIAIGEFGLLFVLPLYLQNVLNLNALQSGYVLAAMAAGAFVSGAIAHNIADATSPATAASIGLGLEIPGLVFLGWFGISGNASAWDAVWWLVLYGIGLGIASAQLTSVVLSEVPTAESGQGSAVQSTVRQVGSALGIAIVATFLAFSVNIHADGSLNDVKSLPAPAATQLEKNLAHSAGSELIALRDMPQLPAHPADAQMPAAGKPGEKPGASEQQQQPATEPQGKQPAQAPAEAKNSAADNGFGAFMQLPKNERDTVIHSLGNAFADGSARAIWVAAGFITLGFFATLGLPRKPRVKRSELPKE